MSFDVVYENLMNDKKLYIMRGISGGGKSYTAQQLAPKENIFSTDDYFGVNYDFDPSKLGEAHAWNQKRVAKAMEEGMSPIVVDNTNTQKWEMEPYIKVADKLGYIWSIKEPESQWWKSLKSTLISKDPKEIEMWSNFLAKKNNHGVPREAIANMIKRWEIVE